MALAWLFRAGWIKKEVSLLEITPVHIPIFIYTCIYIISTGLAMMRGELNLLKSMFFTLKYIEYFVLFFMTYNIVQKEEDVRSLLRYGLVTAMLVTVYAYWYHFSTGQQATAPFETPLGEASREGGEPGSLGGYYLVVFGVLMGLIDHGAGQWLKTAISALLVMLPAFLFTLSRASLLGLAGQFSLLLLLGRRKLFVASGGVLLLTLFFSVDALRAPVSQRVAMTTEGARDRQLHEFRMPIVDYTVHLEDSAAQRVQAWQRIITRHLPKHPFLGHGATGIGFEDTQYGLILGEFGLVGLAVFFWMIGKIFQQSLHLYHVGRQPWIRGVGLGVILVLAGLLLQSFTSNTFIIVRIMQPFWFLVGLMCRLHTLSMKTDERA
ncbi:MAG TPA: O-antigen ligase family protein [Elusimicrobiales bacterium]|nr:O-antigen ligase family protein [Elusimicrobiales bacterium]